MRLLAVLLVLAACTPEDDLGPQVVRVLARQGKEYELRDELLTTLESAREVRGGSGTVRGGGSIVVEETLLEGDLARENSDDVQQSVLVSGDAAITADYVHDGEVLVPRDYETLLVFTFYRHLERALAFYDDLGAPRRALQPFTAFFYVRFTTTLAWGAPLVSDNAAYAPLDDAMLLFPSMGLDEGVPLCANEGVVAHELSHGLKHRILHPDTRDLVYADESWDRVAVNSYRSDDEGLADFFAAVFTGDGNFITASVPERDLDRDLGVSRQFSTRLYDNLGDDLLSYNPYALGSALASFLWDTAGPAADDRLALARVAVAALEELRDDLGPGYRITQLIDLIVRRAPITLSERGCAILQSRLEGGFRDVPTCGILQ
jgi:hypothetical protein